MQSNLKKSLYLGLAALSFASVASVTANSSNANAAKKHAAAKKVTYKTTNKDLDQSVTFKATGKNAVYNKAVGKRSVIATKADMASKANSKATKDLFMAYQEGVTSKGVHYYKVVSFDKKVRGFVYNKGVAKTNNTQEVANPSNATGYLTTTSRFFNQPYGAKFAGNSLKKEYSAMNVAADQFTVSKAVKVNNDQTYYYVTDKNNQLVNGWVNSVYFSNNITDAAKNAQNSANALHVTYVSQDNLGTVLFTKDLNPANLNTNGKYSASDLKKSITDSLQGTGVDYVKTFQNGVEVNLDTTTNQFDKGSNLTVVVKPSANASLTKVNYTAISGVGTVDQKPISGDAFANLVKSKAQLTPDQYKSAFTGKTNGAFNYTNFKNTLLVNGAPLNKFTDKDGNTYTFNAGYTESNFANPALFNQDGTMKTATFDGVNSSDNGLHLYYTMTPANGNDKKQNSNDVNLNGYTDAQQKLVNAANSFNGNVNSVIGTNDGQYKTLDDLQNAIKNVSLPSNDANQSAVNNLSTAANNEKDLQNTFNSLKSNKNLDANGARLYVKKAIAAKDYASANSKGTDANVEPQNTLKSADANITDFTNVSKAKMGDNNTVSPLVANQGGVGTKLNDSDNEFNTQASNYNDLLNNYKSLLSNNLSSLN